MLPVVHHISPDTALSVALAFFSIGLHHSALVIAGISSDPPSSSLKATFVHLCYQKLQRCWCYPAVFVILKGQKSHTFFLSLQQSLTKKHSNFWWLTYIHLVLHWSYNQQVKTEVNILYNRSAGTPTCKSFNWTFHWKAGNRFAHQIHVLWTCVY